MKTVVTILQLLCGLAIILIVLFQSGKSQGLSGAIGGVADSFLAKNKAKTIDAKLARATKWFGAVFLVLCGLLPKLAAIVSIMPQSVLGGAAVIMFSSIVMSGIQLITREPLTPRSMSIVSVALGLGYGLGANSAVLSGLPQWIQLIFGGSGIVPAAFVAILMNVLLPKEKA